MIWERKVRFSERRREVSSSRVRMRRDCVVFALVFWLVVWVSCWLWVAGCAGKGNNKGRKEKDCGFGVRRGNGGRGRTW